MRHVVINVVGYEACGHFFSPGVTIGMGPNYMGCRIMSIQLNYKKAHIDWINCIGELRKNQKQSIFSKFKMAANGTLFMVSSSKTIGTIGPLQGSFIRIGQLCDQ